MKKWGLSILLAGLLAITGAASFAHASASDGTWPEISKVTIIGVYVTPVYNSGDASKISAGNYPVAPTTDTVPTVPMGGAIYYVTQTYDTTNQPAPSVLKSVIGNNQVTGTTSVPATYNTSPLLSAYIPTSTGLQTAAFTAYSVSGNTQASASAQFNVAAADPGTGNPTTPPTTTPTEPTLPSTGSALLGIIAIFGAAGILAWRARSWSDS